MNRLLLTTASAVTVVLAAVPALAQDDWSGPYIGGQVGLLNQPSDSDETLVFDRDLDRRFNDQVTTSGGANAFSPGFCGGAASSPANAGCVGDDEEADAGIRGGYDWQTGSWVYGVVGEVSWVDATDSVSGFSTTPASYTFTRETNWLAAVRGRAGYLFGPYLAYGTAGIVQADVDHAFATSNTLNAFTPRNDDSLNGYQLGVGVERKIGDSGWSVGAEYLFTSLDDEDYTVSVTQGAAGPTNPFILAPNTAGTDIRRSENEFEFDSVRLTATYRFD